MRFAEALAIARLARWPNALIAALGVVVGAWWAGGSPTASSTLLAAVAAIGLAAFANAYNDVRDEAIDRIAHPGRPLPAGELSRGTALLVAWVGAALAFGAATLVSLPLGLLTVGIVALMREYSRRIKRLGLPGNVVVALLASLPFVYGAWSTGRATAGIALAAVAAPLHLSRELAKDLEDAAADAAERRTLAVRSVPAAKRALMVSLAGYIAALILFILPRPAAAVALFPATLLAILGAWRAVRDHRGAPRLFKSAMVLAMLSLFTLDAPRLR